MLKAVFVALIIALPEMTAAAGLVPCGGPGEDPCQFCSVVKLINNVVDWLGVVLFIIVALIIAVMGLRLVSSVGAVEAKTQAKRIIANVIVGYIIFLAGWLIVDFGMKVMVDDPTYGVWNDIQCVAQPTAQAAARRTASGDNEKVLSSSEISNRVNGISSSGSLQTDIEAAAAANGITDPAQQKIFKSLISQESSNCTNKTGPATNFGTAYGCGQLLVSTARGLDPDLAGMTQAQIAAKLRDDDAYNLALSAKYFNQLYNDYGGDTDLALAAYNGGPKANLPSKDCPGLKGWQCEWDSPGCYGTSNTSCTPNTGYKETRHYVENINKIAEKL